MNWIDTEILIVGSGLAGTLFSLELAKKRSDLKITLICRKDKSTNSSYLAQGGIAAVLPESNDSIEQHILDTLSAGHYANNPQVVDHFVSNAPKAIRILESWMVHFDTEVNGIKKVALEGGHSTARVLHHKDYTGRYIMQHLFEHLSYFPNISILEDVELFELYKREGTVRGAFVWDQRSQKVCFINASRIILSTGGIGGLFRYSTNPETATGSGIAVGHRAGATVKEVGTIQFHPTAMYQPSGYRLPLITEALRGAGAVLKNEWGFRLMSNHHRLKDLAPRDVVSLAIMDEMSKQSLPFVYLDATLVDQLEWINHFPTILRTCVTAGIDPRRDWIPVLPAAHYSCGGIETDVNGITNIENLYCLGESACTGFHGDNRLASNSLLEATLMAASLAELIAFDASPFGTSSKDEIKIPHYYSNDKNGKWAEKLMNQLRDIMQTYCGIIQTSSGLETALFKLQDLENTTLTQFSESDYDRVRLGLALHSAKLIVDFSLKHRKKINAIY